MGWALLLPLSLTWVLSGVADAERPDKETLFRSVLEAVPDYQDFLTVDELHQAILDLGEEHPGLVTVTTKGPAVPHECVNPRRIPRTASSTGAA